MAVNWPVSIHKHRKLLQFNPQVFLESAHYSFRRGQIEGAPKNIYAAIALAALLGQLTLCCDRQLGHTDSESLICIHI